MICPNCGFSLSEGSEFCTYCGKKLPPIANKYELDPFPEHISSAFPNSRLEKSQSNPPIKRLQQAIGILLFVLLLGLSSGSVYQWISAQHLQADIDSLQGEIAQNQASLQEIQTRLDDLIDFEKRLRENLREAEFAAKFYKEKVVLITNDGTRYYHFYGCPSFGSETKYQVTNESAAKAKGYSKCLRCS